MDGIERAIRNALAKGDANDRAFRERVYRSAFAALERMLSGNSEIGDETRQRRRDALKAKVFEIETEYVPAMAPNAPMPTVPQPAPEPPVAPHRAAPADRRIEPTLDVGAERRAAPSRPTPGPGTGLAIERDEARVLQARRRSWTGPVLLVVLLVALVSAGWWFWQSGIVATQEGAVQPPLAEEPEAPAAPAVPGRAVSAADDDSWIRLFDPADPTTVTAAGDASASADEQDGETFVQARSGASGTPVSFVIGEGALQTIAGTQAVFRISASADEEEGETQISVQCDFAALGDCGRRRFLVGITREDFLFEVELPNANPGGAGAISINSDVEGGGRSVRIHAISVAPAR